MPAKKCTGVNLINHCKQIKNPQNLTINYFKVNEYEKINPNIRPEWRREKDYWLCEIIFNEKQFMSCGINKRAAYHKASKNATPELSKAINKQ